MAGGALRLSAADAPRINAAALQADITTLSAFGRPEGGTFQSGVSRVGYSDADISGRRFVMDLMRRAGAQVRIDAAGNIFAHRNRRVLEFRQSRGEAKCESTHR